ncbi:hypothetical protein TNCV_2003231 [Trichonephila clavipes]|nr:hypothetical protein TNCV_2003231 [Trichonephila clavipes]
MREERVRVPRKKERVPPTRASRFMRRTDRRVTDLQGISRISFRSKRLRLFLELPFPTPFLSGPQPDLLSKFLFCMACRSYGYGGEKEGVGVTGRREWLSLFGREKLILRKIQELWDALLEKIFLDG